MLGISAKMAVRSTFKLILHLHKYAPLTISSVNEFGFSKAVILDVNSWKKPKCFALHVTDSPNSINPDDKGYDFEKTFPRLNSINNRNMRDDDTNVGVFSFIGSAGDKRFST